MKTPAPLGVSRGDPLLLTAFALLATSPFWSRPISGLVTAWRATESATFCVAAGVVALVAALVFGALFARLATIRSVRVWALLPLLPSLALFTFGVTMLLATILH